MTRAVILARLSSLCAAPPFSFVQAVSPFDVDQQPTGQIDQVFRVTLEGDTVIGGFNYSEDRTDLATIWVARKQSADPHVTYATLTTDVSSLTAAVVRDGAGPGDFAVPDGGTVSFAHDEGREFAVARLTIPINYETSL